jgi:ribosomal protein L37AE/L43A
MENIDRLAEYRKRRKPARRAPPVPQARAPELCTRCDSDEFKLSAAGMVHCAHCGALMRNIEVAAPRE